MFDILIDTFTFNFPYPSFEKNFTCHGLDLNSHRLYRKVLGVEVLLSSTGSRSANSINAV